MRVLSLCVSGARYTRYTSLTNLTNIFLLPPFACAVTGTLRGQWRYTVLANIYCLFLAPHASHARALPLTRHCLALLRSDLLLLRQLANAGLWLQLAAVVDHGAKNEGLVALVDEVSWCCWETMAAHLSTLTLAAALLQHASHMHVQSTRKQRCIC